MIYFIAFLALGRAISSEESSGLCLSVCKISLIDLKNLIPEFIFFLSYNS